MFLDPSISLIIHNPESPTIFYERIVLSGEVLGATAREISHFTAEDPPDLARL